MHNPEAAASALEAANEALHSAGAIGLLNHSLALDFELDTLVDRLMVVVQELRDLNADIIADLAPAR